MHLLIDHWTTLLERTPFGGGASVLDGARVLLWIQTSPNTQHRVTRHLALNAIELKGPRHLAGLVAEAYEIMARPPEVSAGIHERPTLVTPTSPMPAAGLAQDILDLPAEAIEPLEDDEISTTQRLDVVHISTIAALARADESQFETLRPGHGQEGRPTAIYTPTSGPQANTMALSREIDELITQCQRTVRTLDPPGELEVVDEETLLLKVPLGPNQKPYVRVVDAHDFMNRAIVILSETWREAQQRRSLARALGGRVAEAKRKLKKH